MKHNVGTNDRWFRIIGGIIIIVVLGMFFKSWWSLIGVLPLVTGIIRYCPLYALLGISTVKKE